MAHKHRIVCSCNYRVSSVVIMFVHASVKEGRKGENSLSHFAS